MTTQAFANRHEDFCWANPWLDDTSFNECYLQLITNPFSAILLPFETIAPGFGSLFLWGPLVFGVWYKTKSPGIAAIFGIVLVSVLQEPLYAKAVGIGLVLVAVAAGIMFIQIFQRIKQTV
jgi:hypothetical protein